MYWGIPRTVAALGAAVGASFPGLRLVSLLPLCSWLLGTHGNRKSLQWLWERVLVEQRGWEVPLRLHKQESAPFLLCSLFQMMEARSPGLQSTHCFGHATKSSESLGARRDAQRERMSRNKDQQHSPGQRKTLWWKNTAPQGSHISPGLGLSPVTTWGMGTPQWGQQQAGTCLVSGAPCTSAARTGTVRT